MRGLIFHTKGTVAEVMAAIVQVAKAGDNVSAMQSRSKILADLSTEDWSVLGEITLTQTDKGLCKVVLAADVVNLGAFRRDLEAQMCLAGGDEPTLG